MYEGDPAVPLFLKVVEDAKVIDFESIDGLLKTTMKRYFKQSLQTQSGTARSLPYKFARAVPRSKKGENPLKPPVETPFCRLEEQNCR